MRTTTEDLLENAITEQIRGLTPSASMHAAKRWGPVDDIDKVASGEIRKFFVELVDVAPVTDGIYSPSAIENACTVMVWTSYGNLRRQDFRHLVGRDGRQIYLAIAILGDADTPSTIAGLVSFEWSGWQDENTEQGAHWGAHTFAVRFLAPGIPGAS